MTATTFDKNNDATARKLVGFTGFQRSNPHSDRFTIHQFHHIEFWCSDATSTSKRFGYALGMTPIAKTDQSTGNHHCASYILQSNDLVFAFTAPYGTNNANKPTDYSPPPLPYYNPNDAHEFVKKHGLAVRAVGVLVEDAEVAYHVSTEHGGRGVQVPVQLTDQATGVTMTVSEISLYGDVVLRFVSCIPTNNGSIPYLPNHEAIKDTVPVCYGLQRLDHAVGNVPELLPTVDYICKAVGFHEFAEFVSEDVGTVDSGLNSMVLANNNEMVLLPVNEPTLGTKRKSQIQTYLEQNEGAGLQHLALKTNDIFTTLKEMRARSAYGGFDFMPRPSDDYYNNLPTKIGLDIMNMQQYKDCEELGILVDRDDQGVLLQIFTKPLGDRPTVFIEIIQRLCLIEPDQKKEGNKDEKKGEEKEVVIEEVGGCGGFGKGNFSELFKSIEVYETDLGIN